MGNACCSCAGRPSKKHSSSKSSLQEAERLQNGIEKSPSLKSVKMMPLSALLGSSSANTSMSSINLQPDKKENQKTGNQDVDVEQDDSCYDSASADDFSENNDEWLPQRMMGTLQRGISLYVTGTLEREKNKKKRDPEEAEEALEFWEN